MKRWTEEEVNFLKENYPTKGRSYCAEILDRTEGSIRTKTSKLNLKSSLKGKHNLKSNKNYKIELENTDYEVLEPYINNSTKILHKHKVCGYEWAVTPNNLISKMRSCPKCHGRTIDTDIYRNRIKNTDFECLEEYKGTQIKILHRHKLCGYEWKTRPKDILKIKSCPACVNYSSNFLYCLYFPILDLYKIGITSNIERRQYGLGVPSEIILLEDHKDTAGAYKTEQFLLEKLTPYLVLTDILKNGNTEVFKWPT